MKTELCEICHELEGGFLKDICNVCFAKMSRIIEIKTPEEAEEFLILLKKYPTSKSALIDGCKYA